jgi:hypothetical protein
MPLTVAWRERIFIVGRKRIPNAVAKLICFLVCHRSPTGRYAGKPETVAALRKALERAGVRFLAKGVKLAT